jgi:tetratricopeptide (TPR) repeat protein
MYRIRKLLWLCTLPFWLSAQEEHNHAAPEKLGSVSFPISCSPLVRAEFNRGIALLHSFAYKTAEDSFRAVAEHDRACAMAHWGVAMAQFHQLWDPPLTPQTLLVLQREVAQARTIGTSTKRERDLIDALALIYRSQDTVPYQARVANYRQAVCAIAAGERQDVEAQVFCALALLSSASPQDKSHRNQKSAAELLEPLFRALPDHPGIPHYLIHAYDNAELAPRGVAAAKVYSNVAPSAPHALHMPSHIFTRLGLWDDSIASNRAARKAAREQNDTGEELHAMDYLVYAYLQQGRDREAEEVVSDLDTKKKLDHGDFKIAYAATAMPIRYFVERSRWADAAKVPYPAGAPPHVIALAAWARGLGLARTGHVEEAGLEAEKLLEIEGHLHKAGSDYWATQVSIQTREVQSWTRQAARKADEAVTLMRRAADEEDAIEKLPVTPGPIVPAREQLGYLLLEQTRTKEALEEFQRSLLLAPGRFGAVRGASLAAAANEQ